MTVVREEAPGLLRLVVGAAEAASPTGTCPGWVTGRGRDHPGHGRLPRGCLVLVTMVAGMLLAACSPDRDGVGAAPAPATTYSAPSSEPGSSLEATKQTIIDTYAALWPAIRRAERAPADQRREILSAYVTEPVLGSLLDQIENNRQQGRLTRGEAIVHVFDVDVEVDGRRAVLHDCQDNSKVALVDEDTGKKVNQGVKEAHLVATLRKLDEGWRVKKVNPRDEPCSVSG